MEGEVAGPGVSQGEVLNFLYGTCTLLPTGPT